MQLIDSPLSSSDKTVAMNSLFRLSLMVCPVLEYRLSPVASTLQPLVEDAL